MSVATAFPARPATVRPGHVDNRIAYLAFASAYLLGHGATALTIGPDPALDLPSWLPMALLGLGFALGAVAATVTATRSQRGLDAAAALPGKLLGTAWITGFVGLFLAITGLTATTGNPDLATVLWPAGSGLVVGLIYIAEGALRRDVVHYALGSFLLLLATSALFLPAHVALALISLAGGSAYLVATVLVHVRRARG